jgi:MraZ protein
MFTGESTHSLDTKHRVFVPKRFQHVLGTAADGHTKLVLTRGFEKSLFLFSTATFAEVLLRMKTQPFGGSRMRNMQRRFFSHVHETQLDASGRVVLPEKLRRCAGIEKEVVMVGVADRAEIWDRARWERFDEEGADDYDELDVVLTGDPHVEQPDPDNPSRN